jgi:hypothetical protein
MRASLVLSGTVLLLGVGLFRLGPVSVDDVACGLSNLARCCFGDAADEQTEQELDRLSKATQERIHAKHVTIGKLFAGRITTRQAAATFLILNNQHPVIRYPEEAMLGSTPEEQCCRQVQRWIHNTSKGIPGDKETQLLERLERELEELLRRPELLHVPPCYP